jgi:uncharacterized damage-inducible protein DinB
MQVTDINGFLKYYERIRERTLRVVNAIPKEYIDWTYKAGRFTFADIARHIGAIERYLYMEIIQGNKSCYTGCGKTLADGYEEILKFLECTHTESMEIIARLQTGDLNNKCIMPGGAAITTASALRAMVEHEIHHRGQLYIYLGFIGCQPPPIFGLTSEQVIALSNKSN